MNEQYRVVRTHEPQPPSGEEYISRLVVRRFYSGAFRNVLYGETLDELRVALTDMLAALDKPILSDS